MVSKMENGHGKVWICLLILVLAAVVIGLLYYTTAAKEPDEEGFLIQQSRWSQESYDQKNCNQYKRGMG